MKGKSTFKRLTAAAVLLLLSAVPMFAARGSADFTRYVAIGDSYGAGLTNASLLFTHQHYSYPAIIARQAGVADFQQPLVSEPGIGPELQLVSISPLVIAPKASNNGAPMNLALPRPYNNLGIPGARLHDAITLTGAQPVTNTQSLFAQFILRGLGTQVQQTLALHPTFITVWLGGNDVLDAVLSGTPAALTPLAEAEADYATILDTLIAGAPNAGIAVGGLGDVSAFPYATTIPPVLVNPATSQPVLGPDGKPIFFVADLGGGNFGQLTPGALVLLPASAYLATGYGIPAALAPLFPTLPNVGKPLPDAVVLSVDELTQIKTRTQELNAAIRNLATSRNLLFVDFGGMMERFKVGVNYGGIRISTAFLTGGLFGYDGFHPTDLGSTLIANEWIKQINAAYDTEIPYATITEFFQNNGPSESSLSVWDGSAFTFTTAAWDNLLKVSNTPIQIPAIDQPAPAPATGRGRSIRR